MHESRKMGGNFISCFLFLHFIIIMCSYGSRARDTAVLENHQTIRKDLKDLDKNQIFFTLKDLKVGKRMAFYFPIINPATSPKLWPREKSDTVPFSSDQLPYLLKRFSFSPNSTQAKAMKDTLRSCERKPSLEGEVKFCATSYESMLEFAQRTLGVTNSHHIQVFATTHKTKLSVTLQNYTFLENIVEVPAPNRVVACHWMPYPYAVFFCHSLPGESKVFKISLAGDNGDKLDAMAICHMDTSDFGSHVAFQVLGVKPGVPVCHVFPDNDLIWVPKLQSHDYSAL